MVGGKLTPTGVVERRNIFRNSLVAIVKTHHTEFCKKLGITVKEEEVKKFHPDFEVDKVPEVEITELPPKPDLEKVCRTTLIPNIANITMSLFQYQSAKEMLEAARNLFEAAPRVATVLEEASSNVEAEKKETDGIVAPATEEKVKVVPKALAGVPMSLIEKIRAKEREKKVRL